MSSGAANSGGRQVPLAGHDDPLGNVWLRLAGETQPVVRFRSKWMPLGECRTRPLAA